VAAGSCFWLSFFESRKEILLATLAVSQSRGSSSHRPFDTSKQSSTMVFFTEKAVKGTRLRQVLERRLIDCRTINSAAKIEQITIGTIGDSVRRQSPQPPAGRTL
jgi:hypothetical protein